MQQNSPRITVDGLCVSLGGRVVLDDLHFDLTARRIGIIGRNGSGKSTLARVLAGLVTPQSGQVTMDGINPALDRGNALRLIGILFQNPDHQIIFPTVTEEIAFGLLQLGMGKAEVATRVSEMLARFDRGDWAERSVTALSEGQRRLLCLMSVLAMAPRLLILDEPLAGLDIPTSRALSNLFAELDQTLVHITHDPVALGGYDHLIWLESGRIHAQGRPNEIFPAFLAAMKAIGDAGADL